jgi:hypothetical protein
MHYVRLNDILVSLFYLSVQRKLPKRCPVFSLLVQLDLSGAVLTEPHFDVWGI